MEHLIEKWTEKVEEFFKKYSHSIYPVLIFSFFFLGSVSLISGLFFTHQSPVQARQEFIPQVLQTDQSDEKIDTIMVDISGAVEHPGLYELKNGDRMADLIEKSGGYSKKAHQSYLSRSFNLSQKLHDEEKVYIPFQGEPVSAASSLFQPKTSSGSSKGNLINVNTATAAELENLPGIGKVRAENIISGRPYKTAQELVSKKIVTQKIFNDIKEKLTF